MVSLNGVVVTTIFVATNGRIGHRFDSVPV